MVEWTNTEEFFNTLKNKIIEVKQKDNFIKFGYLRGWDDNFIYLEFLDDKTINAIAIDSILHIKEKSERKNNRNNRFFVGGDNNVR